MAESRNGKRPSASRRGYGQRHRALRSRWATRVRKGTVVCARCGELIQSGDAWDLGHDDDDRSQYNGPEHAACNRRAGGLSAQNVKRHSREW